MRPDWPPTNRSKGRRVTSRSNRARIIGKTPPCADALIAARIGRVVIASHDPNPRVAGTGIERMRAAGIIVDVAEQAAALELNKGFFQRFTQQRPWVRVKVAASLDGRTAMASGESQWITGAEARADVQYWRARSCAIVTGVGTVLADDPQLNVRDSAYAVDGAIRQPLRVVVDSTLRTPPNARVLQAPGKVLVAAAAGHAAAAARRCRRGGIRDRRASGGPGRVVRRARGARRQRGAGRSGRHAHRRGAATWVCGTRRSCISRRSCSVATLAPLRNCPSDRLADAIDGTIADVRLVGDDLRLQILRIAA